MDLKYITTFKTIVKEGSYAKAAEKLNYTQSAITFHIEQLEKELNVQLFERLGRRMALTKAGSLFLPHVEEVLSAVERLQDFQEELASFQGELHIGFAETQLGFKMAPLLKELHARAPNGRLFLQSMNCYAIRDALLKGELDLGVLYEDIGGFGTMLTTYPMGSFELVLVSSKEVRQQYPDFITEGQQLEVPFIINERECVFRQMFERYLRGRSIRIGHTMELESIPTIKNLVASGLGITFLPRFTVEQELVTGDLVEIPLDLPSRYINAVCAHHKNKWLSPLMQTFINLCSAPVS